MAYEASFNIGVNPAAQGLAFKPDGTKMYVQRASDKKITEYALGTAWNVATASETASHTHASVSLRGLQFKSDGSALYVCQNAAGGYVHRRPLSVAWDITTTGATDDSLYVESDLTDPRGVAFKSDGGEMYVVGVDSDTVFQYTLGTAWQPSTAGAAVASFSVASETLSPTDINFKSDGSAMYVIGGGAMYQYSLSTPWDLSTASGPVAEFDFSGDENGTAGFAFKADGLKVYVVGVNNETVYQYAVTSAWDISTASPDPHDPEIAWTQDPDRDPINAYPRIGRGTADPYSTAWPPIMRRPNKGTGMVIVSPLQSQLPQNQHEHAIKWLWGDIADPLSTYPRMAIGTVDPMSHRWAGGVNRPFRIALDASAGITGPVIGSRIFNSPIFHSRAFGAA